MRKVIVITGGEGKIGKVLTKGLSKTNYIISLSRKQCDVTSFSSMTLALADIIQEHKRIDVLINNAGVMLFNKVLNIDPEELELSLSVNFKGAVFMIQKVLPIMLKQNSGRIINISSIRGITGAPRKAVYSASKFALQGFSDSLRYELRDTNVQITNICPGRFLQLVHSSDIIKTVNYILSLSNKTFIRNIILGGQL